jgi:hypothetical protein
MNTPQNLRILADLRLDSAFFGESARFSASKAGPIVISASNRYLFLP